MDPNFNINYNRKILPLSLVVCINGLFKVNLEFSFSIPGLFQTWNLNKPGFEKLDKYQIWTWIWKAEFQVWTRLKPEIHWNRDVNKHNGAGEFIRAVKNTESNHF